MMEFKELTQNQYDDFAKKCSHFTFWHDSAMVKRKENQGCKIYYFGVENDSRLVCATSVVGYPTKLNMVLFQAVRGFLIDYNDQELLYFFLDHLKQALSNLNGVTLRFDPYVIYQVYDKEIQPIEKHDELYKILMDYGCSHEGFTTGFDITSEPRWMVVLDLKDKDEKTILKNMDQQTRWSVNRSLKYPIHIDQVSTDEEIKIFAKMMDETAKRKNFMSYPVSYYKEMLDAFGDRVEIVLARLNTDEYYESLNAEKDVQVSLLNDIRLKLQEMPNSKKFVKKERVCLEDIALLEKKMEEAKQMKEEYGSTLYLAGSMFIWDTNEVIYLLSASDERFKKLNAPYAIQYHQICKALKLGYTRYNFYGTSGDFSESSDDYGVFMFKAGFDAHVEELIGTFNLVVNSKNEKLYRSLKKVQSWISK